MAFTGVLDRLQPGRHVALRLTSRLLRPYPHRGCAVALTTSTLDAAAARAVILSSHATGKQVLMSEDVSSQTNPDDVDPLLATGDAGDTVEPVEAAQAGATDEVAERGRGRR